MQKKIIVLVTALLFQCTLFGMAGLQESLILLQHNLIVLQDTLQHTTKPMQQPVVCPILPAPLAEFPLVIARSNVENIELVERAIAMPIKKFNDYKQVNQGDVIGIILAGQRLAVTLNDYKELLAKFRYKFKIWLSKGTQYQRDFSDAQRYEGDGTLVFVLEAENRPPNMVILDSENNRKTLKRLHEEIKKLYS